MHAGVRSGALLVRGQRLAVGLDHTEREHGGPADRGVDDPQLVEAVLARGLHRDRALLRAAAAAPAAGEHGDEHDEQRDSVTEMLALVTALALVPTPIGVGPRYHPPPAAHGLCVAAPLDRGSRVHLELFAGGRVVIVPAAVGVRDARLALGRVTGARCRGRAWTTDPTGVVSYQGRATLGGVFAVWGQALGPTRLLGFRGDVRVYVNGLRRKIDPRRLRLRDGDELVLEVGPAVPPHRSYRFPRR
jgi:hypothetical protein